MASMVRLIEFIPFIAGFVMLVATFFAGAEQFPEYLTVVELVFGYVVIVAIVLVAQDRIARSKAKAGPKVELKAGSGG